MICFIEDNAYLIHIQQPGAAECQNVLTKIVSTRYRHYSQTTSQ